jgi:hypothetical protein
MEFGHNGELKTREEARYRVERAGPEQGLEFAPELVLSVTSVGSWLPNEFRCLVLVFT